MFRLLCTLLLIIGLSAAATADTLTTYNITFTTTSGSPAPVSGSFTYDSTNPGFTNFVVNWDGVTFDFPPIVANLGIPTGCPGEANQPSYVFAIMSQSITSGCAGGATPSYQWAGLIQQGPNNTVDPSFAFELNVAAGEDATGASPGNQPFGTAPLGDEAAGGWSITPTPEPGTAVMLVSGLLAGIAVRRKQSGSNCLLATSLLDLAAMTWRKKLTTWR